MIGPCLYSINKGNLLIGTVNTLQTDFRSWMGNRMNPCNLSVLVD